MSRRDAETERGGDRTADLAIRESLHRRIAARVEATDFETPDEYVEFAMEELLARVEDDEATTGDEADPLDDGETEDRSEEVETRLESLGYL